MDERGFAHHPLTPCAVFLGRFGRLHVCRAQDQLSAPRAVALRSACRAKGERSNGVAALRPPFVEVVSREMLGWWNIVSRASGYPMTSLIACRHCMSPRLSASTDGRMSSPEVCVR